MQPQTHYFKFLFTLLFLYAYSLNPSFAQSYSIQHYGVEEGLGSSNVYTLFQDSKGYLWISTAAGLSRFDGKEFEEFSMKDGVVWNVISSIHEGKDGVMWFKRQRRLKTLLQYDGRKFHQIPTDSLQVYSRGSGLLVYQDQYEPLWIERADSSIYKAASDMNLPLSLKMKELQYNYIYDHFINEDGSVYLATVLGLLLSKGDTLQNVTKALGRRMQVFGITHFKGNFWLLTDEGVMKFDGKKLDQSEVPEPLHKNIIHNFAQDNRGNLWLATIKGLYRYDGNNFTHFSKADGLLSTRINRVFIDSRGYLWLSTNGGLQVFDHQRFITIDTNEELEMFSDVRQVWRIEYRQILEDHEGNVWFNTTKGIAKFSGFTFAHYQENNPLKSRYVRRVYKDKKDRLWIGYNKEGISICQADSCQHFDRYSGISASTVNAFLETPQGEFWVGHSSGLLKYENGQFKHVSVDDNNRELMVRKLVPDKKGNVWLLSQYNMYRFDGRKFKKYGLGNENYPIQTFHLDERQNVWFFSREGLFKLNQEKDEFELVGNQEQLGWIVSMADDVEGNLWMVNSRGGIVRYDGKYAIAFDEMDGLASNKVRSILIHNGYAWLGTVKGIDRFDIQEFNSSKKIFIEHIGKAEGFTPIECNYLAYKDKHDVLWFGTSQGVTAFNPQLYEQRNAQKASPIVYIDNIKLGYENVDWIVFAEQLNKLTGLPENLQLDHNENTLTFECKALTFADANKFKYQYQLEGIDTAWQEATHQTTATYANLSPNHYTFKVKATEDGKQWSTPCVFSFTIQQPIWTKTWFISLFIVLLIIIYFILKIIYIQLFSYKDVSYKT